jgi:hypothetical protein
MKNADREEKPEDVLGRIMMQVRTLYAEWPLGIGTEN